MAKAIPFSPNKLRLLGVCPALSRIASYGDSLMATHSRQDASGTVYPSRSIAANVGAALNGQARIEHAGNFGVTGERTDQILARLPQVLAYNPDIVITDGGTNDLSGTINTVDQIVANITTYLGALLAAGIKVCHVNLGTRTDSSFTGVTPSVQRQRALAINQRVKNWAALRTGIVVIDVDPFLAQPIGGIANSSYIIDGQLHWNGRIGYLVGNAIAQVVKRWLPQVDRALSNALDLYDATNLPTGNLLVGGLLTGTTGNASTNAFTTGQVATGWQSLGPTGTPTAGTMVYTKEARPQGFGDWQVLTMAGVTGGSSSADVCGIQQVASYAQFAPGDVVELTAEIDWTSGAGLRDLYMDLTENDGATGLRYTWGETTTNDLTPTNTSGGPILMTAPRCTIRAQGGGGSKFVQARVGAILDLTGGNGAANCQIKVGRVALRKVN